MKTIIHKALLVFFFNTLVFGQSGWVWLNPLPQGNLLHDLQFVNSSTAYCISYINVLKSTDAGNTWQLKWTNVNQNHVSLYFADVNTGYLLCDSGLILKSTNTGEMWQQIQNFNLPNFHKVYFVNQNTGFILRHNLRGYQGTALYRTTNGSLTWGLIINDTNFTFNAFSFVDQSTGYCAANRTGYDYAQLKFFKTTNSGSTWDSIQQNTRNEVRGTYFFNVNTGIVYGFGSQNRSILLTTNGGMNWSGVYGWQINDLSFINSSTGYALRDYNDVIKSTNAGLNWVLTGNIGSTQNGPVGEFEFTSENYGLFTGLEIIKTTNGAANWSPISAQHVGWIWDVDFADANTGYADGGPMLKTTNGGNTWFKLPTGIGIFGFSHVEFINALTGFSTCIYNSNFELIKTSNGGYDWGIVNYGNTGQLNEIQFINDNTGFILAKYSLAYKTTNAGMSWIQMTGYGYGYQECLYFYDDNLGFIGRREGTSGTGVICRTTNGGINWDTTQFVNTTCPNDFYFVNSTTGFVTFWVSGGNALILKTTDAGNNWIESYSSLTDEVQELYFPSINTGYGVTVNGSILKTTNSGLLWVNYKTITDNFLSDMYFINDLTGIVVGDNSTILKTTTGGLPIGLEPISSEVPESYILHQNYPNPFNPVTRIKIQVAGNTTVKLTIYDVIGREIATLVNEQLKPGLYEVEWDGTNYPSGVYFYRLTTSDFTQTRKMVLLK